MKSIYRNILIGIIIFFAPTCLCLGQAVSITVKDAENNPLIGSKVELVKLKDSSSVVDITNKSGTANFDGINNGQYIVKLSYLGYKPLTDTIKIKSDKRIFEFKLKENAIAIGEVTVSAQRPLIRQEEDKMIIDPMPLINSSTNTLEVLEKTPGLYVDQDGGIYLTSNAAAAIYINGRELKMSNEDIATLLRSLPPGSVQRIEVMRTPSTKYDAASSGGIINIVLKKGVNIGRFGSVNAGMNQGFYGNRFAGFNFNNNGDKMTSYINANYNHNDQREELNSVRTLTSDTALHQSLRSRQQSEQAYLGYGLNYNIRDNLTFSYDGRINASFPKSVSQSSSFIQSSEDLHLAENENFTTNKSQFLNIQQDLGIVRKFDTSGSELDTKLSYSYNNNSASLDYLSNYTVPLFAQIQGEGDNNQQRHFILFQSDLTYQFPKKVKLEAGIKSTYQDYSSKADYLINLNGTAENDPKRTNAFNYQESINAAYAQASKTFGKIVMLKAGVRLEHTYMKGNQTVPADTSFLINRVDWFPYVYISRTIVKFFGVELKGYLIYRRTITRPGYQNLNPYIKYVDEFLYETGNPSLKPQFTNNYEINISFEDTPVFAFGQNFTNDVYSSVTYKDKTNPSVAVKTYDNLGKNKETYLRAIIGIPPGKKYFFAIGAQYNYTDYRGFYENEAFHYSRDSWRFFTFQSLNIFKQTKITLSGFMMLHGEQNFYRLKNFGQLNMSITQKLFKKKLTITLSARDILHTMVTKFNIDQGSINSYGDRYMDNQRFGINIRYSFGFKKKDEKHEMMQQDVEE